mmetsp:Transcript_43/g.119  ORF Transcript_43/g.119 Transcript_43/m.119 type:complete len:251 (-) Transcript_43:284-1036(-)
MYSAPRTSSNESSVSPPLLPADSPLWMRVSSIVPNILLPWLAHFSSSAPGSSASLSSLCCGTPSLPSFSRASRTARRNRSDIPSARCRAAICAARRRYWARRAVVRKRTRRASAGGTSSADAPDRRSKNRDRARPPTTCSSSTHSPSEASAPSPNFRNHSFCQRSSSPCRSFGSVSVSSVQSSLPLACGPCRCSRTIIFVACADADTAMPMQNFSHVAGFRSSSSSGYSGRERTEGSSFKLLRKNKNEPT